MKKSTHYNFGELLLKQKQQQTNVGANGRSSSGKKDYTSKSSKHEALASRASHPVQSSKTSLPLDNLNKPNQSLHRSKSEPVKTLGSVCDTSRYKTELCRTFEASGVCMYGKRCQFAHGGHELRDMVRHSKYKTRRCRKFHTTGFCPYGPRCQFIHYAKEPQGHVSMKTRARPICILSGSGSSADTPFPPSSLGRFSPPPSATPNGKFYLDP